PHAVRHHDDHTAIVLLRTGLDYGGLALTTHPRPRLHILIGDRPPGVHHRRITTGAGTTGHRHHTAEQQTNSLELLSLIPHVHCCHPRMTTITRPAPSRTGAVSINGWHPGPGSGSWPGRKGTCTVSAQLGSLPSPVNRLTQA